jgi:hypothetical protein
MASWDLGTGMGLDLECDDCSYVVAHPGTGRGDWQSLWRSARKMGWAGTAEPTGPHLCPDCSTVVARIPATPTAA